MLDHEQPPMGPEGEAPPPSMTDESVLSFEDLPTARPKRRTRQLVPKEEAGRISFTPEQRLLVLDTWERSGLPAGDFAPLVGVSKHTLYAWRKRFATEGPAGLAEKQRGCGCGSRLNETTKRAIVMMKRANPEWGVERISAMLLRGPALPASPGAVSRVLREAGYEMVEEPTAPHPDKVRHFERAKPNQLWQTDLFTFVLKRQNRRVHLVAFMDDHSRFIVAWGLHATASTALVVEVLRTGLASYGAPEEVLTDNGPQYITWRGTSRFSKECQQRGIKQIVATPRRPQTLGKVERFWGTLWRECLEQAIFLDLEDARRRIGHFIDHYNFQRPHGSLDKLVPADRFFGQADAVRAALQARVADNAVDLARNGTPRPPLYLTGNVGGEAVSVHAAGDRVFLQRDGGEREEIDFKAPESAPVPEPVAQDGARFLGTAAAVADPPDVGDGAVPIGELTDAVPPVEDEPASTASLAPGAQPLGGVVACLTDVCPPPPTEAGWVDPAATPCASAPPETTASQPGDDERANDDDDQPPIGGA